jgi:hypothetical protein
MSIRTGGVKIVVLAIAGALLASSVYAQVELVSYDFEDDFDGAGLPNGWFDFYGDGNDTGGVHTPPDVAWNPEITLNGGAGSTQGFTLNIDSSPIVGTYWYGGVGNYGAFADDANPLAGGVAGTDDPSRFRFSADIKVTGNLIFPDTNQNVTPIEISVSGFDDNYDATYGEDPDPMSPGANRYVTTFAPVLVDMADYVHISFTLDQGTISAGTGVTHGPLWGTDLALSYAFTFNGGGFDNDAGNSISIDNVLIEFLDTVPELLGDYNENDVVDAADYTVWRDAVTAGLDTLPHRDPSKVNGTDLVGDDDFTFWRDHFGETLGIGSGSGSLVAATAVPEPSSLVLALFAAMVASMVRRCATE